VPDTFTNIRLRVDFVPRWLRHSSWMAGGRRSCIFCGPAYAARNRGHHALDWRV